MTIAFKPAVRENVGLLIGLAGGTGSGKTFTAMRLASGIAGDKPFALIDTEARRALHYADKFRFDHAEMKPPFSPASYAEAILAADKAGYPVIVVDSTSHEWSGSGGVLDMQEAELDRMAGDDWKKREAVKMAAWIKPKMQHKAMVNKLLQVRAHVILCLRAEEKVEMLKIDGKMKIVPKQTMTGLDGWVPICEKSLPFELTASFLFTANRPGVPLPIKLPAQLRALFQLDRPVDESCGQKIAVWARGGIARPEKEEDVRRMKETAPTAALAREAKAHNDTIDAPVNPAVERADKFADWFIANINAVPNQAAIDGACAKYASDLEQVKTLLPDRNIEIMNAIAEKTNEFFVPSYDASRNGEMT